jgi:hypothetical protein
MNAEEFSVLVSNYSDIFDSSFQNRIDLYPMDAADPKDEWDDDYPFFDEVKFLK